MKNYNEPLSAEQRQKILDEIHQREFLEQQALAEEKEAREAEAKRQHHEALALEARRLQEERRERLLGNLKASIKLMQQALEAFQEGNERQAYVLLVKADPFFGTAKQQLNQTPERPAATGLPTVKVKADNPLGYMLINSEDLRPDHEILEDSNGY